MSKNILMIIVFIFITINFINFALFYNNKKNIEIINNRLVKLETKFSTSPNNNIEKRENVIFLGDKHYSVYPSYVRNFDICIIPYNIDDGQHGGDSMKAYEYLLTRKKVVGTKGNGLLDLEEHLYLVDDEREFSSELKSLINEKRFINMDDHSWESKAKTLIQTIQKASN